MGDGSSQFDMAHSLAADLGTGNFNTTLVTDLALVADTFILTAVTLPVLGRSKYLFTEKTVLFRLKSTVIYCFGLGDLTVRPFSDLVGRCQTDRNSFKSVKFDYKFRLLST